MKFGSMNLPGPGDQETWGPCTGDWMDPRTPADLYDDLSDEEIESGWMETERKRREEREEFESELLEREREDRLEQTLEYIKGRK